jgi:hypothetical protein
MPNRDAAISEVERQFAKMEGRPSAAPTPPARDTPSSEKEYHGPVPNRAKASDDRVNEQMTISLAKLVEWERDFGKSLTLGKHAVGVFVRLQGYHHLLQRW